MTMQLFQPAKIGSKGWNPDGIVSLPRAGLCQLVCPSLVADPEWITGMGPWEEVVALNPLYSTKRHALTTSLDYSRVRLLKLPRDVEWPLQARDGTLIAIRNGMHQGHPVSIVCAAPLGDNKFYRCRELKGLVHDLQLTADGSIFVNQEIDGKLQLSTYRCDGSWSKVSSLQGVVGTPVSMRKFGAGELAVFSFTLEKPGYSISLWETGKGFRHFGRVPEELCGLEGAPFPLFGVSNDRSRLLFNWRGHVGWFSPDAQHGVFSFGMGSLFPSGVTSYSERGFLFAATCLRIRHLSTERQEGLVKVDASGVANFIDPPGGPVQQLGRVSIFPTGLAIVVRSDGHSKRLFASRDGGAFEPLYIRGFIERDNPFEQLTIENIDDHWFIVHAGRDATKLAFAIPVSELEKEAPSVTTLGAAAGCFQADHRGNLYALAPTSSGRTLGVLRVAAGGRQVEFLTDPSLSVVTFRVSTDGTILTLVANNKDRELFLIHLDLDDDYAELKKDMMSSERSTV